MTTAVQGKAKSGQRVRTVALDGEGVTDLLARHSADLARLNRDYDQKRHSSGQSYRKGSRKDA